jgi:hypothetical protein
MFSIFPTHTKGSSACTTDKMGNFARHVRFSTGPEKIKALDNGETRHASAQ